MYVTSLCYVLAQANQQLNGGPAGPGPGPAPANPFGSLLWGILIFFVVFYFVMFRSDRKRRRQADELIQNLKKNDRVVTIGGIVGTVVSTKGEEVVLKVDESSNTKMTFVRKAIQRVIGPETEASSQSS